MGRHGLLLHPHFPERGSAHSGRTRPDGDADHLLPSDVSCDHDICYWKLNRGEMDVASIWQVLTQSVTVLSGSERQQTAKVYESPDENSTAIAE